MAGLSDTLAIREPEGQIETVKRIKCNEGPPQIVASMIIPVPQKIMATNAPPIFEVKPVATLPILLPDRPACGRHVWRVGAGEGADTATCGNCEHGIPVDMPKG